MSRGLGDVATFYWLVGLFEGEAWFGYSRRPIIQLEMSDEHVVARVAALFGVSYCRRGVRKQSRVPTYRVAIAGERAMRLMKRMAPYMCPRRGRRIAEIEAQYVEARGRPAPDERIALPSLEDVQYSVSSQS